MNISVFAGQINLLLFFQLYFLYCLTLLLLNFPKKALLAIPSFIANVCTWGLPKGIKSWLLWIKE